MNFESIFILPNLIRDRSRCNFWGILIKIPKVTCARSSFLPMFRPPLILKLDTLKQVVVLDTVVLYFFLLSNVFVPSDLGTG